MNRAIVKIHLRLQFERLEMLWQLLTLGGYCLIGILGPIAKLGLRHGVWPGIFILMFMVGIVAGDYPNKVMRCPVSAWLPGQKKMPLCLAGVYASMVLGALVLIALLVGGTYEASGHAKAFDLLTIVCLGLGGFSCGFGTAMLKGFRAARQILPWPMLFASLMFLLPAMNTAALLARCQAALTLLGALAILLSLKRLLRADFGGACDQPEFSDEVEAAMTGGDGSLNGLGDRLLKRMPAVSFDGLARPVLGMLTTASGRLVGLAISSAVAVGMAYFMFRTQSEAFDPRSSGRASGVFWSVSAACLLCMVAADMWVARALRMPLPVVSRRRRFQAACVVLAGATLGMMALWCLWSGLLLIALVHFYPAFRYARIVDVVLYIPYLAATTAHLGLCYGKGRAFEFYPKTLMWLIVLVAVCCMPDGMRAVWLPAATLAAWFAVIRRLHYQMFRQDIVA